jgi:hypothetical protein
MYPTTLKEANAILAGRCTRKLGNNTYLQCRDSKVVVKLHNTDIVIYHPKFTELRMDGWNTVVTRQRLNEVTRRMGVSVYTQKGLAYLSHQGNWEVRYPFKDGVRIYPNGTIKGAGSLNEVDKATKLKKRIRAFAALFIAKMRNGEIQAPGAGDCFYCQMRDVATHKPLTQADHILSHLKENYFVPSMLWNANDRAAFPLASVSQVMLWALASKWEANAEERIKFEGACRGDFVWDGIRKNLIKWIEFNLKAQNR